jgi:hypothetical protein
MVAGAGYAAAKHSSNKQQAEAAQNQQLAAQQAQIDELQAQQAPPAPAPAPAPGPAAPAGGVSEDRVDQLVKLKGLLDAGVLSEDEFAAEKARILAS